MTLPLLELASKAEISQEAQQSFKPPPPPENSLLPKVVYEPQKQQKGRGNYLASTVTDTTQSTNVAAVKSDNIAKMLSRLI